MSKIFTMMLEFFKTGLFAVGGGLATIPFLQEMSEKYGWFTIDELSTMIAVSESTPGAMGVNMSTYVGFSQFGFFGGILTTLSLVAPSIIVICIIANYFQKFKNARLVKNIFAGLKPAVVAFILAACLSLFVSTLLNLGEWETGGLAAILNWKCILLLIVLILVRRKFSRVHPVAFIGAAAVAGIVFSL